MNGLIDRCPSLIARCSGIADVVAAVNFAREHDLLLSVRGGGHNVAGTAMNDGGIVIDLSAMRGVRVDPEARTVRAQGGATWGDVDRETQLFGLATPGGDVSTTGIGGLTLHGGWGWLRRKYGYCVDNLLSVDIVTADGRVRTASERSTPTSSGRCAAPAATSGSSPRSSSACTRSGRSSPSRPRCTPWRTPNGSSRPGATS